ncbi:MAG TPA: DNA gyrase inhibitor YacG [Pyrinomonadaceae bacterium]
MKCPTCGKPVNWQDNPDRPFCSERCKLIDFGKWANEEYRVPEERTPLAENSEDAHTPAPESQTEP